MKYWNKDTNIKIIHVCLFFSIRIAVNCEMTELEIDHIVNILQEAVKENTM